ncbi:MAG: hypothetical protein HUU28_05700 [Planctomycetaceae bacterium]|jgi:hypothetical protein|nr:hypothetical protein [Planctomycetaceae bacterium]
MNIQDAPHGINVVVETGSGRVYIGRFDSANGFTALLHDCDIRDLPDAAAREQHIRESATYGIDVKERDVQVDALGVTRVRLLRDIPKL